MAETSFSLDLGSQRRRALPAWPIGWGTLVLAALAAIAASTQASAGTLENSNTHIVLSFYDAGLNRKDIAAASKFIGPLYIQHNPTAKDGREGFRAFIEFLRREHPRAHNDIVRVVADGDYVMLHVHEVLDPGDRGTAIVDNYRLKQGRIVEHWDVKQAIPPSDANGNGMFGPNRPGAGE